MEKKVFLEKFEDIYKKISEFVGDDSNSACFSLDPDYDMDYGVDGIGNIVLNRESTFFPVSRLMSIKYRLEEYPANPYMLLVFEENVKLYMYWYHHSFSKNDRTHRINIEYEAHTWSNDDSERIIKAMRHGWQGWWDEIQDFIIDREKLIAYKGDGGAISIPEGVVIIKEEAFKHSDITDLRLASTVKEIGAQAFSECYFLQEVYLNNVQSIGDRAFEYTALNKVVLPESIKFLGKQVFAYTHMDTLDSIVNHSDVTVLDSQIMNFDDDYLDIDFEPYKPDVEAPSENSCQPFADAISIKQSSQDKMRACIDYYLEKILNSEHELDTKEVYKEIYTVVDKIDKWTYLLSPNYLNNVMVMKEEEGKLEVVSDLRELSEAILEMRHKIGVDDEYLE